MWKKVGLAVVVLAVIGGILSALEGDEVGADTESVLTNNPDTTISTSLPTSAAAVEGFVGPDSFSEGEWPLTVDGGVLRCEPPGAVVIDVDGTDYAVNGLADSQGFELIDPIWAEGETTPRMDLGPLIDEGLDRC